MDVLTKEQRRRNMQAIRSRDTKMEVALARALFSLGYRHRKNDKTVFGKPDLTFKKLKIAVFVDSESNIKRDVVVNCQLKKEGWKVLRFWSSDVNKKLRTCIQKIERTIDKRRNAKEIF